MLSKTHKTIRIRDKEIAYEAVYRTVKHPRLEFKTGNLRVIVPRKWRETEQDLINKHERWIYKKHIQISRALKEGRRKKLIMTRTLVLFRDYVHEKIKFYIDKLNLKVKKVTFRKMRTKWASCSSSRSISINTLLRYLPEDIIDYVIFHEITHLKEWKHSKRFWNIVDKEFVDTAGKEKDLMSYWFLLQKEKTLR